MIEGIARYLHDQGIGVFSIAGPGNIFPERMPSSPDEAIYLHTDPDGENDSELGYDQVALQVIVRGTKDPRVAKAKADEIYGALQGLGPVTLPDGTRLISLHGSVPGSIGADGNGRYEYSINFSAEIRALTAHRV